MRPCLFLHSSFYETFGACAIPQPGCDLNKQIPQMSQIGPEIPFLCWAVFFYIEDEAQDNIICSGTGFLPKSRQVIIAVYWLDFIFVSQAGLEVTVSTKELLLSATQFSSGNLLSITLEAAYSVPEAFTPDTQQNCMACLQIPAAGEVRMVQAQ